MHVRVCGGCYVCNTLSTALCAQTNLGWKSGAPKAYPRNGYFTYRLETNPQLFEGVRYGWLTVNAAPATPWHITAFRAVAQYK